MTGGGIEGVPATPDRWEDVVAVLGGNGDLGCWFAAEGPEARA
jgi:hypothetical protein